MSYANLALKRKQMLAKCQYFYSTFVFILSNYKSVSSGRCRLNNDKSFFPFLVCIQNTNSKSINKIQAKYNLCEIPLHELAKTEK